MERHPTGFMTYELPTALRQAASTLAAFVGGDVVGGAEAVEEVIKETFGALDELFEGGGA